MIMALSVAFLPIVYRNCWMGWKAWKFERLFPRVHAGRGPVAIDAPDRHLAVAGGLDQHLGEQTCLGVVAIDQHGDLVAGQVR